jgi:hypothetical protein
VLDHVAAATIDDDPPLVRFSSALLDVKVYAA